VPTPRIRRATTALLALGAVAAAAPAMASAAATVTVTGDTGAPVPVPAGAPPTVRNMSPEMVVAFPPGGGKFKLTVTAPNGTAASSGRTCSFKTSKATEFISYSGNGAYTATVTNYGDDDSACATPLGTETYAFVVGASTSVTPPPGTFLLRSPGSFSTGVLALPVAINPGASSTEVRFGPNAQLAPDGGILSASTLTYADHATGQAQLRFPGPGVYTVVARPTRSSGAGPWSPPIQVVVAAPFDVSGGLLFLDSRGPSYSVRIRLREASARGRVSIAIARRDSKKRYGKYRSLGSARISSRSEVSKRFKVGKAGTYRLRFSYKGTQTIAGGRITFPIRITRRITFG
jgi:hypothetical protein